MSHCVWISHHIPKIKLVSKMEYLDDPKKYEERVKEAGKELAQFGSGSSMNHHGDVLAAKRSDAGQALKFKFKDPGHVEADNETLEHQHHHHHHHHHDRIVSTTFSCHVYYGHQFRCLRRRLYDGEDDFIESLSRCQSWDAQGGKSEAGFMKTLDQRFVLKFVRQNEFQMFLANAQSYFDYMGSVLFLGYPSVLVHIVGVYQMSWSKTNGEHLKNQYVIVMPNLWYSKHITKQFDLKGSLRNRFVEKSKAVLLDKNFIQFNKGFPMPLKDESQAHLWKAVHNDTLFLSRCDVIDYSLLVGINEENGHNELVVGIVDYLRKYTWDKRVEEQAKSIGMAIGKHAPTIQSPDKYMKRFREAMERYFMAVPDRKSKRPSRPVPTKKEPKPDIIKVISEMMIE